MKELKIDQSFGRTMVLVPHQDDEILLTSGILKQSAEKGIPLTVVMVTNGDCGCKEKIKGQTRLMEALLGMGKLGVRTEQIYYLGYADTGMATKDSFLMRLFLEHNENMTYASACTSQTYSISEKPEYHMQRYQSHAPYTRKSVKSDIKDLIRQHLPENIFTTLESDLHGDHRGLYLFLNEILEELYEESGYEPNIYGGLVHSCAGDAHWPNPDTERFDCPAGFEESTSLKWEDRICLKIDKNVKRQALMLYETALEPNAYDFLMSFVKEEEIFWKIR